MKKLLICLLGSGLSLSFALMGQTPPNDVGQYYPEFQQYADTRSMSLSYFSRDWPELEQWRVLARAKMQELLAFSPEPVALDPEILEKKQMVGYTRYRVRYSVTPQRKTEAFLLIPDGLTGQAPAVVALHDHGGFYYYGKEKITETENQPKILKDFITEAYGGRTYADELARKGFVVLCPDAFYFGSQRLDVSQVSDYFTHDFPDMRSGDPDKAIAAFNQFSSGQEQIMAKYMFAAGTTWTGILTHSDRRAVDYLLTRPEIDPGRIGCMGLSIGGLRSAYLFGLDPRIRAGVVAGWMPSYPRQMENYFRHHTWMVYVPRLLDYLDIPDIASLNAPRPLMVMNCRKDGLYPMKSMEAAAGKLESVYVKMNASDHYQTRWYDVPHSLTVEMQEDAILWMEKWLKGSAGK